MLILSKSKRRGVRVPSRRSRKRATRGANVDEIGLLFRRLFPARRQRLLRVIGGIIGIDQHKINTGLLKAGREGPDPIFVLIDSRTPVALENEDGPVGPR